MRAERFPLPLALTLLALYALLGLLGLPERATSVLLAGVPALLGFAYGRGAGVGAALFTFLVDALWDRGFRGLALDPDHLFLLAAFLAIGEAAGRLGQAYRFRERALALLYRASRALSRLPDEAAVLEALPRLVQGVVGRGAVGLLVPGEGGLDPLHWLGPPLPRGFRFPEASLPGEALREGPKARGREMAFPLLVEGRPAAVLYLAGTAPLLEGLFPLLVSFSEMAGEVLSRRRALRRLAEAAYTDPLTGLLSRRAFEERLKEEWSRSRREERPLGLVLLDLDGFKGVNDTLGHAEGDRLLVRVAEALKGAQRAGDLLFRWAGDEFALLLPNTPAQGARRAGARYQRAVAALGGHLGLPLSASFGHAGTDEGYESPEALLEAADRRLYQAKARWSGASPKKVGQNPDPPLEEG